MLYSSSNYHGVDTPAFWALAVYRVDDYSDGSTHVACSEGGPFYETTHTFIHFPFIGMQYASVRSSNVW